MRPLLGGAVSRSVGCVARVPTPRAIRCDPAVIGGDNKSFFCLFFGGELQIDVKRSQPSPPLPPSDRLPFPDTVVLSTVFPFGAKLDWAFEVAAKFRVLHHCRLCKETAEYRILHP